jgi:hypothetical protein
MYHLVAFRKTLSFKQSILVKQRGKGEGGDRGKGGVEERKEIEDIGGEEGREGREGKWGRGAEELFSCLSLNDLFQWWHY